MSYKIILITEFSKPWNSGWSKKAGLEKNGHSIIPFNPNSVADPAGSIWKMTKEIKPDFLLHQKDELPPSVFEDLRKHTKIVQWYPDPVIPKWLPPYVSATDIFITMSEGLVEGFRKLNPNSFWLTEAFEPSFYEIDKITDDDIKTFSTDVTFVGNLGSKPQYLSRRRFLQSVIKHGFSLKWWGPKLPRKFSTIPLLLGKLGRSYGGKFVWGEKHAKIAKLSGIYLGFDAMPHIRKSMSERLYIAVGCGAFYMCNYVDGIEDILEPDKEIVTFQSEEEMIDKIKYYIGNDDLRMKIAGAGQKRILKDHTYEIRMKEFMKIIEDTF